MAGKLYIFMRSDLHSLNAGKAMAQSAHAATAFTDNFHENVYENILPEEVYDKWTSEGVNFGTTIVLDANEKQVDAVLQGLEDKNIKCPYGKIIDQTYPFKAQNELLPFITDDVAKQIELNIIGDKVDNYGMIDCTRIEYTCAFMFLWNDEDLDNFQNLCNLNGIKLYR